MQLVSIKTAKEAPFPVEFVYADKNIVEVIIGKLRIRKGESYSPALNVLVEKPHTEEDRYRVTAKLEGFASVQKFYQHQHEAKSVADDLRSKGADADVERVTVLVNETGEIVGTAKGEPVKVDDDGEVFPF